MLRLTKLAEGSEPGTTGIAGRAFCPRFLGPPDRVDDFVITDDAQFEQANYSNRSSLERLQQVLTVRACQPPTAKPSDSASPPSGSPTLALSSITPHGQLPKGFN
jgi:hypothetical protein